MASNDTFADRGTFGLLPEPPGRLRSFGASMVINVVIAALLLLLTIAAKKEIQDNNKYITQLVFPVDTPKPIPPPVPKVKVIPPPPKLNEAPPRIQLPKETPPPPKPVEVKLPTPELPKMEAAPPKKFTPPPQPKVGLFTSDKPTAVANNMSKPTVKAGGFGDPEGAKPNPNAHGAVAIAAVGSFNSAPGVGAEGAGRARAGNVQGVQFGSGVANGVPGGKDRGTIASAGFSDGVVGGTGKPGSHGTVAQGSFGNDEYGAAGARPVHQDTAAETPIVVQYKPLPEYTAEARQLRIEGDVTLKVRFLATGQVEVLGIVSGLGHGLDEQARIAAQHIRFKPATRGGQPVDEISIIHVTFQMA
jgi:TonB family protein